MPKTLQSPCGPNTPGAAPYAAPLWQGSEINKQKIHTIPSTEIKTVYIGLLPAGWDGGGGSNLDICNQCVALLMKFLAKVSRQ